MTGKYAADDIVYPAKHEKCGEIIVELGHQITKATAEEIVNSTLKTVEIVEEMDDLLAMSSILEDPTVTHEDALLRIYQRLRPGNPPQLEKAIELFNEKFFDANRYRLGRVGRFRINRKFDQDIPDTEMTLKAEDIVNSIRYVIKLRVGDSVAHVDDIDNLGNRRLRRSMNWRRRNPKGLLEAASYGSRAYADERRRGDAASHVGESKECFGGDRILLRAR